MLHCQLAVRPQLVANKMFTVHLPLFVPRLFSFGFGQIRGLGVFQGSIRHLKAASIVNAAIPLLKEFTKQHLIKAHNELFTKQAVSGTVDK